MNGIVRKAAAAACVTAGLGAGSGCYRYYDLVDPCYPQRYNFAARQSVNATMAPQVHNGHVLDQTVWNHHFVAGSDKLTPGGLEHLAYLARRRPCPDPCLYLQTAQDLTYDPTAPEKLVQARGELDRKRADSIKRYLEAQTAGRPIGFEVVAHDPAVPGLASVPVLQSVQQFYLSSVGVLGTAGGGGGGGGTAR